MIWPSASGGFDNSPLTVRQLASLRFVFCAAPSYLEMRGVPQSLGRPRAPRMFWGEGYALAG